MIPEFRMITLALPEESSLVAAAAGLHALEFANISSYVFPIKLDIALAVLPPPA